MNNKTEQEIESLAAVVNRQCQLVSDLQDRLRSRLNFLSDDCDSNVKDIAYSLLSAIQGYEILVNDAEQKVKFNQPVPPRIKGIMCYENGEEAEVE